MASARHDVSCTIFLLKGDLSDWERHLVAVCIFFACIYFRIVMVCEVIRSSPELYGCVVAIYNYRVDIMCGRTAWYALRN